MVYSIKESSSRGRERIDYRVKTRVVDKQKGSMVQRDVYRMAWETISRKSSEDDIRIHFSHISLRLKTFVKYSTFR